MSTACYADSRRQGCMALRAPPATAAYPRSGHAPPAAGVWVPGRSALRGSGVLVVRLPGGPVGSAWLFCVCVSVCVSGIVVSPGFWDRGFGTWCGWGVMRGKDCSLGFGGVPRARVGLSIGVLRRFGCSLALGVPRFGLCIWALFWLAVLSTGLPVYRSCCVARSRSHAVIPACSTLSLSHQRLPARQPGLCTYVHISLSF